MSQFDNIKYVLLRMNLIKLFSLGEEILLTLFRYYTLNENNIIETDSELLLKFCYNSNGTIQYFDENVKPVAELLLANNYDLTDTLLFENKKLIDSKGIIDLINQLLYEEKALVINSKIINIVDPPLKMMSVELTDPVIEREPVPEQTQEQQEESQTRLQEQIQEQIQEQTRLQEQIQEQIQEQTRLQEQIQEQTRLEEEIQEQTRLQEQIQEQTKLQ